uniref:Uncharacterized protein n=1 Tax=Arundo donax TaxID=35708 RepID=A0A0A9B5J5_ARUDO
MYFNHRRMLLNIKLKAGMLQFILHAPVPVLTIYTLYGVKHSSNSV